MAQVMSVEQCPVYCAGQPHHSCFVASADRKIDADAAGGV
jgi:hypothetical protein